MLVIADTIPAAPVLALMTMGVVVAIFGHIAKSQRTVVVGIVLLFAATALMVLVGFAAFQGDEVDPRAPENPRDADF